MSTGPGKPKDPKTTKQVSRANSQSHSSSKRPSKWPSVKLLLGKARRELGRSHSEKQQPKKEARTYSRVRDSDEDRIFTEAFRIRKFQNIWVALARTELIYGPGRIRPGQTGVGRRQRTLELATSVLRPKAIDLRKSC